MFNLFPSFMRSSESWEIINDVDIDTTGSTSPNESKLSLASSQSSTYSLPYLSPCPSNEISDNSCDNSCDSTCENYKEDHKFSYFNEEDGIFIDMSKIEVGGPK
jgi:hypothetical protein